MNHSLSTKQIATIARAYWDLDRILNHKNEESLNLTERETIIKAFDELKEVLDQLKILDEYGNVIEPYRS